MTSKIEFDKYYTPKEIAEYCYNKTMEVIGVENITEIIEPSAGQGVFLDIDEKIIGYDIKPDDPRIKEQDYLKLDIEYKKGRLILGNPPYGYSLGLAQKFYRKSVKIGDYIGFILPISQLNSNCTFYEFDLIYSEDLGIASYSGIELHCVFNIYQRPLLGLNKKKSTKLRSIKIVRQDSKYYSDFEYDVRMCYWGNATAGKILYNENEHYAGEYKIKINVDDEVQHKEIKNFIENYNWSEIPEIQGIAMKRLKQFHILERLKEHFDYLE